MYYELALISVAIGGGYWGYQFVRQESLRGYGIANLIAALLALLGFAGQRTGDSSFGIPGAIGLGAGVCLLVLGPLARGLARRAAAAERFGLAKHLLDVAEVLAPGSGVGDEKALLSAMREIRDGNIEQTLDALRAAKHAASPEARIAIDERIAMLYLAAYRWDEAIAHAEQHLFDAAPPASETPASSGVALRRALGIAPPVWVELLGAYGYAGNLEQAARMLARLEDACANRPDAALWVHRGRMVFLALAGRVAAVRALVEPRRSRHMKPSARTYWLAVAHERHGDRAEAEAAYQKARSRSRGRPRVLIEQALARLPQTSAVELGPTATEVIERIEAQPVAEVTETLRAPRPWGTRGILIALVAASTITSLTLGTSTDIGVLVRGGALVRGLVDDGEWWRLVSNIFVQVGGIHLFVNLTGAWFLARLAEELLGTWRMLAVFALSGIGGAVASYVAVASGVSAGASGAILGLLGAVFVELAVRRKQQRTSWWGSLAMMAVAQIAVGFLYPMDQWAHGGGLAVGALAGLVLSPRMRWHRISLHLARVIALAFIAVTIASGVLVARTRIVDSLLREPRVDRATSTVVVTVPQSWQRTQDELFSADLPIVLLAQRVPAQGALADQVAAFLEGERKRAKDREAGPLEVVSTPRILIPPGWIGHELVAGVEDTLGTVQRMRVLVLGRYDGDAVILASLYVPETIAAAAPWFFTMLLGSIRAR